VGGVGGEIVVPRPSASASLTGRRQKIFQINVSKNSEYEPFIGSYKMKKQDEEKHK
jgi:hypothetical protein